jgi:nitrate/nitrite-specific signal transduction histidine kinase
MASDHLPLTHSYLRRFNLGLNFKLLVVVVMIALFGILVSSLLLMSTLQEQFIEQIDAANTRLSLVLEASLDHAMLTRDSAMLNAIVQQAALNVNAERIRVLDPRGIVRSSSWPTEIGLQIDWTSPACKTCHTSPTGQDITEATILHPNGNGDQELLNVTPIINEPQCYGCHGGQTRTLGVLMIQTPLTDLNLQMQQGLARVVLASLVTFVILVGLMVPTLRKVITTPIGELSRGVAEIGAENLDYRVRVNSRDELGQLAAGFNDMQSQLKTSRDAMSQRNQEIALLYEVALITGQLLDLDEILSQAMDTVVNQLGLEVGVIYLWDNTRKRFERIVSRGMSLQQKQLVDQKRQTDGGDLTRDVALTGEVFFEPDVSTNAQFVNGHMNGLFENLHRRSYVNVPLKSQGKVVGTLELASHAEQPLTDRQVEILKAVGTQIGIAIDNTSLLAETQRNAHEALTLNQLSTKVSSSLELDQVLEAVAKGTLEALAGSIGMVGLLDVDQEELVIKAIVGTAADEWRGLRIPVKELKASVFAAPVNMAERPPDLPEPFAHLWDVEQITSALAVPLLRGKHPHGQIVVLSRAHRTFTEEETQLLTRLAQQVVVAIENARLYQQVRYMAVLEERDRLAREMHDNLAQSLGYLNLKASITDDMLSRGENEQAQTSLREMKQITREAYTDTREAIFNLRSTISSGGDLVPMLREYLAEYRAHYGLEAELVLDDDSLLEFSTDVAVQISRIIQEALTNIRKHAHATHAWVRFERELDQIRIVVEDNGRGFDLALTPADGQDHLGLRIMRERAESVAGTIKLDPQLNRGTRVIIRIPAQSNK